MEHIKHFIASGGYFMIPMVVCSIVGIGIIIERTYALMRKKVISDLLASQVYQFTPGDDVHALYNKAGEDPCVLAGLIQTALSHSDSPKADNIDAIQVRARAEAVKLERGLVTLEVIVGIGPLLGLLGTVSGLITVFAEFGRGGTAETVQSISEATAIAAGISEALNMTVAGLVVAIPALIFHGFYSKRVENYMTEMEGICLDLLAKLYRRQG